MDVAGLSPERRARSGAARRISARDPRARRPHPSVVHSEPAPATPLRPPATDRSAGDVAAADAADQLQADYFVRLLSQNRRLIEQRIGDIQKAMASAQASGDADALCNLRRLVRIEEQDRDSLDGMLEKLRRRFVRRTPGEPPAVFPRPRSAIR